MSRSIYLSGGPHDGLELHTSLDAPFLYSDGFRCYRFPNIDRALYKRLGGASFHFVGNRIVLCACGVFRKKGQPCKMCGGSEEAT